MSRARVPAWCRYSYLALRPCSKAVVLKRNFCGDHVWTRFFPPRFSEFAPIAVPTGPQGKREFSGPWSFLPLGDLGFGTTALKRNFFDDPCVDSVPDSLWQGRRCHAACFASNCARAFFPFLSASPMLSKKTAERSTGFRAPNLYAALEKFKSEQSTANYQP